MSLASRSTSRVRSLSSWSLMRSLARNAATSSRRRASSLSSRCRSSAEWALPVGAVAGLLTTQPRVARSLTGMSQGALLPVPCWLAWSSSSLPGWRLPSVGRCRRIVGLAAGEGHRLVDGDELLAHRGGGLGGAFLRRRASSSGRPVMDRPRRAVTWRLPGGERPLPSQGCPSPLDIMRSPRPWTVL